MSTHFSEDEFVLAYYSEPGLGERREHLDACEQCRAELASMATVLDQVTPTEVPELDADYESRVWDRVSWRLRGERKQKKTRRYEWLAAAALIAIAFTGGLLIRNDKPVQIANTPSSTAIEPTGSSTQQQRDRILLVVVGDHFDDSERMLIELTNLTPDEDVDVTTERERASELLASNRLYRSTALSRGEDRVATLLDELEPVLMQIAHGPSQMTPDELRKIQKRVESKGLVFKLRVLRADVRATSVPHLQQQPNI